MNTVTLPRDLADLVHIIPEHPGLYVVESRTADDAYLTDLRDPLAPRCLCPHGEVQARVGRHPYCWHVRTASRKQPALYAELFRIAKAAHAIAAALAAPTHAA